MQLRRGRRPGAAGGGGGATGDRPRRRCFTCLTLGACLALAPVIILMLSASACNDKALAAAAGGECTLWSLLCTWRRQLGLHTTYGMGDHVSGLLRTSPPPPPPPTPRPPPSPSPSPTQNPPSPPPPVASKAAAPSSPRAQETAGKAAEAAAQRLSPVAADQRTAQPAADDGGMQQHSGSKHTKQYISVLESPDDIQLPKTDADIERIMKFPHVDECNTCKVCVPHYVLAKHPLAQEKAKGLSYMLETGDLLETVGIHRGEGGQVQGRKAGAAAAAARDAGAQRRLQRRLLAEQERGKEASAAGTAGDSWPDGALHRSSSLAQYGQYSQYSAQPGGSSTGGSSTGASASSGVDGRVGVVAGGGRGGGKQSAVGGHEGAWEEAGEGWDEGSESGLGPSDSGTRRRRLLEADTLDALESNGTYYVRGQAINIREIAPGNTRAPNRTHLPNCTVCWGCKHILEPMASGDIFFGSYYAHEPGGSPSWLFQVSTNKTKSGWAVVKVWCVPVQKVKQRGLAMCTPKKVFTQVKLLLAQQQITANCGMNDIVPKLWIEPIHGVLPGHGFRVDWLGLWFDTADGVSVQNLQEAGKPPLKPELLIDMLSKNVNHTEIKLAALFDLLFSQCDRHQQNIFITEKGQLRFIDNDQVYATAWRKCGIDSMIVPTTQKFMINHLGFFYVLKYPHKDPGPPTTWTTLVNPLLLLDYRCHVSNGKIAKDFPPQVRQCMIDLSKQTSEEIYWEYGYPALRMADAIRNRSRDMLEHGYEWTLMHGEPTNQPMHRYKVAPSCCNMTYERPVNKYACADPAYKQMSEIPYGNPWHGGKWHGTEGKDTGTYVGGTVFR